MRIYAIDPGRKFGWAVLQGKTVADSGVLRLSDDRGVAVNQIRAALSAGAADCGAVWCESRPFAPSSGYSAEWAGAIRGSVSGWCAEMRINYAEVTPQAWKSRIAGRGDMTPREYARVLSLLTKRDLLEDEAAAIGVGLYGAAWEVAWLRQPEYRLAKGRGVRRFDSPAEAIAAHVARGGSLPVEVRAFRGPALSMARKVWR